MANVAVAEIDEGAESGSEGDTELSARDRAEIERKRRQNQKRKQKKKTSKAKREAEALNEVLQQDEGIGTGAEGDEDQTAGDEDIEVEYVPGGPELTGENDAVYHYFSKVFEAFQIGEKKDETEGADAAAKSAEATAQAATTPTAQKDESTSKAAIVERILQQEIDDKKDETPAIEKLSKKKQRAALQPSIAELKAVHLKSLRNTVPVPRHWCFKRKYLAGKRGYERTPFELPDFIKRTGIEEMRAALQEKEDEKSLKSKMRERVRPKMGKIDIDYQKLHDAFFRWQTKPKMSMLGDIYYEGKEFETQMREKKPGELTDDLRIALGMPVGPNANRFPPPWLIAMQRYGPPPSYPNIKIPGLNAPIPETCAFGYHAGGWGKPPVDELGKPLYGDVFGTELPAQPSTNDEDEIERKHWGELDSEESDVESESDESGEEGEGQEQEVEPSGLQTPGGEGFITPSGIGSSVPTGVETPDSIELRKRKMQEEGSDTPATLYNVLPEKRVDRVAGQMMGSTHVYDIAAARKGGAEPGGGVEVTLQPEELDLADPKGLQKKYEEGLRKQRGEVDEQDFSDMVAEHAAKQKRKRKVQEDKRGGGTQSSTKKYKEFKF